MTKAAAQPAKTASQPFSGRPIALTIAGFDPSSGAGITADLKVFAAHDIYGMACITALTVQSTLGVRRVEPIAAITLRETLACLREDVIPSGVKIGMLATAETVGQVAAFLSDTKMDRQQVVLDPVLRSSSRRELLHAAGVNRLRAELLARVGWVTPNLDELATLAQLPMTRREDVPVACRALQLVSRRIHLASTTRSPASMSAMGKRRP